MNSTSSRRGTKDSVLLSKRRRIVASLEITSRAVSGSKRTKEEIEIVVDEFHFFAQRNERFRAVEQTPQNCRQFGNHFPRRIRIEAHQRRNRVQCVEEEMRIDLILQRLHAR